MNGDMRIERVDGRLFVESDNAQRRGGLVAIAIGAGILLLLARLSAQQLPQNSIGELLGAIFIVVGLYFVIPRRVTVIFDPSSKTIHRTVTFANIRLKRTRSIPFADVLSIGYDGRDADGQVYSAVLRLRSGEAVGISANPAGAIDSQAIDTISNATGLMKRDITL